MTASGDPTTPWEESAESSALTGPGSLYSPMRQAPRGLAIAGVVMAIVLTVVEVATAVASGPAASRFREEVEDGGSSWNVFTVYDGLELLLFPVMVATYVVSCLWLQFARSNALAIEPRVRHQRGAVWAWLGWWVPIVSFWFPFQVVRDVQEGSRGARPATSLGVWWTAWLVYIIGNRVTANVSSSSDADTLGSLPVLEAITSIAAIVGCILWCRLVLRITEDQRTALSPR